MRTASIVLVFLLCGILTGCGWHLRGQSSEGGLNRALYVEEAGTPTLGPVLREEITNRGGTFATRTTADIIIEVSSEKFSRRPLSLDPNTGKVREIELVLKATVALRDGQGRLLMPRDELAFENDYIFDETSVLGTSEQDAAVKRDLAQLAARSILFRVQAVNLSETAGTSS